MISVHTFHCQANWKVTYMSFSFIGRIVLCFILFNFIVFFHALICTMCIILTRPGKLSWWHLLFLFQPMFHFYSRWKPRFSDVFSGYRSRKLAGNGLRAEVFTSFPKSESSILSQLLAEYRTHTFPVYNMPRHFKGGL